MNALSIITWMQDNTFIVIFIVMCFLGLMFGLKILLFSRLNNDRPDEKQE